MPNGVRDMGFSIAINLFLLNGMMNPQKLEALRESKETLNSLLAEFRTGKIVGARLKKELEHILKQITILENA